MCRVVRVACDEGSLIQDRHGPRRRELRREPDQELVHHDIGPTPQALYGKWIARAIRALRANPLPIGLRHPIGLRGSCIAPRPDQPSCSLQRVREAAEPGLPGEASANSISQ